MDGRDLLGEFVVVVMSMLPVLTGRRQLNSPYAWS
jgi:hypothetical protein